MYESMFLSVEEMCMSLYMFPGRINSNRNHCIRYKTQKTKTNIFLKFKIPHLYPYQAEQYTFGAKVPKFATV